MSDYDAVVKEAFDRIAPTFRDEAGDWQRVLRDAVDAPPRGRPLARRRLRSRRSRWAVALVAAVALIGLVALPALGVGRDLFALRSLIPGEPKPTSERVLVTSGVSSGVPWTLTAYASDHGICVDVNTPKGSSGSCGSGVRGAPAPTAHGGGRAGRGWIGPSSVGWTNEIPSSLFASGVVAVGVARVELVLADGTTVATEPIAAPEKLDVPLGFYVLEFPRDAVVRAVLAKDASGTVLQSRQVRMGRRDLGS